jgi:hypothetical protein
MYPNESRRRAVGSAPTLEKAKAIARRSVEAHDENVAEITRRCVGQPDKLVMTCTGPAWAGWRLPGDPPSCFKEG